MIYIQSLFVDNTQHPRRIFSQNIAPSGYTTPEAAAARQENRKRNGAEFVNCWCIKRFEAWTEYQRYITEAQAAQIIIKTQAKEISQS